MRLPANPAYVSPMKKNRLKTPQKRLLSPSLHCIYNMQNFFIYDKQNLLFYIIFNIFYIMHKNIYKNICNMHKKKEEKEREKEHLEGIKQKNIGKNMRCDAGRIIGIAAERTIFRCALYAASRYCCLLPGIFYYVHTKSIKKTGKILHMMTAMSSA